MEDSIIIDFQLSGSNAQAHGIDGIDVLVVGQETGC